MVRTKEQISAYQAKYYEAQKERIKARVKAYALKNKDKIQAYKKAYRDEHKDETKAYKRRNYSKLLVQNKEWFGALPFARQKWFSYRGSAKQRGIAWNLTFEQFSDVILGICHYCGLVGGSVDRKDSMAAYSVNNILPCCSTCNRMKNIYTYEVFIEKCKLIAHQHGK